MTKWRVIPLQTHNAFMNMALDEAVSESVASGGKPTIRFWRWDPSAVSIGYFQGIEDEVNLEMCKTMGIDVVRRRTGGGAVYHDYEGEITYSITAKEDLLPKGITESYKVICQWIIDGLANLDLEGSFHPINDILVSGKKISGNAQTRRGGVILQHGTILYDLDVKKMFSLLKVGKEKISDKMIKSVEERVTSVKHQKDIGMEEVYEALVKGFTKGKEFQFGDFSEQEKERARELAKKRYTSKEWNFQR